MADDDVAEYRDMNAQSCMNEGVQSCVNMAHYPNGALSPYGWGLDPATEAAAKEYARVQQSVMVLQQASVIRADKALMAAIKEYLLEEKARVNHLIAELEA